MIREAILTVNEAAQNLDNYALYVDDNLTYLYIADKEFKDAILAYETDGLENKILFAFGIKEDIYMDAVWARKGFGPLAYKVAMQMRGTLAPYWMESRVTPSAARVWKEFFDGKGSDDVNKELTGVDPKNYRHYWYRLKKKLNYSKNLKIDKDFVGQDKYGEVRSTIQEMADTLLSKSMRSIY